MAEQFSVVMVVSIVPPATSSSCSSLICSGLLVSSLILVGCLVGCWVLECRARELQSGIGVKEVVVLCA
jgi:hypothetical protein